MEIKGKWRVKILGKKVWNVRLEYGLRNWDKDAKEGTPMDTTEEMKDTTSVNLWRLYLKPKELDEPNNPNEPN